MLEALPPGLDRIRNQLFTSFDLIRRGWSRKNIHICTLHLLTKVLALFVDDPAGEVAAALTHKAAIEHFEGLRRNRRFRTPQTVRTQLGRIERIEQRDVLGAPLKNIDTAALALLPGLGNH